MKWTIPDIIDLEYFLAADRERDERALRQRDEQIYLEDVKPFLAAGHEEPRGKIHRWVESRRDLEQPDTLTPGELFRSSFASLLWLAAALGCLLGAGLALSLFRWYGDRPINVTWFFCQTVVVQLAVLCFTFFILVRRRHAHVRHSLLQSLMSGAVEKFGRIGEGALANVPGEHRASARAGLGVIRAKRAIYGSLAFWPVLIATQLFAVCFNVGLLIAIIGCVRFSALSFGWYSTLENPHQFPLVRAVALPWSWLPNAMPNVEQVEKSRVMPAQNAQTLDVAALRSWWPFLCYGVVFYGLMPRAFLLAWAMRKQRRALDAIPFDHAECQALLARLGGLQVEAGESSPPLEISTESIAPREVSCGECAALVPVEIEAPDETLIETIQRRLQQRVSRLVRAEIDCLPACRDALKLIQLSAAGTGGICVVIVIEAWQSPRQAYVSFIQEVRRQIGSANNIVVMLIATETGVAEEDWQAWSQRIQRLGDPYLRLEKQQS